MPEPVSIPISIFDMVMEYTHPNMKLVMDRADVVDRLFDGYKAWNIKVDDVEIITQGKPSEQGIKFKIPAKRTSFFFGAAQCRLTCDDAGWELADEIAAILNVGLRALIEIGGIEIGVYKTSIALHIQPKNVQFVELLKPFASPQMTALDGSPVRGLAAVVQWDKRRVTLDGSAQLANAIFLRFERDFKETNQIEEIARQLRADEEEILKMLNVQEERS